MTHAPWKSDLVLTGRGCCQTAEVSNATSCLTIDTESLNASFIFKTHLKVAHCILWSTHMGMKFLDSCPLEVRSGTLDGTFSWLHVLRDLFKALEVQFWSWRPIEPPRALWLHGLRAPFRGLRRSILVLQSHGTTESLVAPWVARIIYIKTRMEQTLPRWLHSS